MKTPSLECPKARYAEDMRIRCEAAGSWCGHSYFKRCKGWWALSEYAAGCPLRKEDNNEQN